VEAIIVEMQDVTGQSLGLQWLFLNDNGVYGSSGTGDGLQGSIVSGVAGGDSTDDQRNGLAAALAGTAGQLLGVGQLDDDLSFNVVVNALNNNVNANILSTPTLLTMDNQEASIVVGQNVPIVTGSYSSTGDGSSPNNPFQTIERENVGISLKVTPHINKGDSLVLEILQEVSSLTGAASEVNASDLITNERKIETKVLAGNGQTIVLGGLIKDDVQSTQTKVPFLGDIPWLGRLFRNDSTKATKTHLMVFIRSTIIRSNEVLDGATAEKYQYIRDVQRAKADSGVDLVDADKLPMLPEWQAQLEAISKDIEANAVDVKQYESEEIPAIAPVEDVNGEAGQ
jgi:general secretion pathway protein D